MCSDLARLGVLQAVFEKGSLDEAAGAGGGAVTAEPSPPIPPSGSGGGGGGLACPGTSVNFVGRSSIDLLYMHDVHNR